MKQRKYPDYVYSRDAQERDTLAVYTLARGEEIFLEATEKTAEGDFKNAIAVLTKAQAQNLGEYLIRLAGGSSAVGTPLYIDEEV